MGVSLILREPQAGLQVIASVSHEVWTGLAGKWYRVELRCADTAVERQSANTSALHTAGTRRRGLIPRRQPSPPRMHRHWRHGQGGQDLEHHGERGLEQTPSQPGHLQRPRRGTCCAHSLTEIERSRTHRARCSPSRGHPTTLSRSPRRVPRRSCRCGTSLPMPACGRHSAASSRKRGA